MRVLLLPLQKYQIEIDQDASPRLQRIGLHSSIKRADKQSSTIPNLTRNLDSQKDYLGPSTAWRKKEGFSAHPLFKAQFTCGVAIHPRATTLRDEFSKLGETTLDMIHGGELFEWPSEVEELLWSDRVTPQQLIRGFSETRPICVQIQCHDDLEQLFWECRSSLASGSYYAAVCTARGCLEIAVTDVAVKRNLIPAQDGTREWSSSYPARHRINLVANAIHDARTTLHEIYSFASEAIHCGTMPTHSDATALVRDLCNSIESVYSAHEAKISAEMIGDI